MMLALIPEEVRLQRIDRVRRNLEKINERWNNRLTLESVSLSKDYLEGRLIIALDAELASSPEITNDAISANCECTPNKARAIICYRVDPCDGRDRDGWNNQPMLVSPIKLVDAPERFIPTLARATRFDRVKDKIKGIRGNFLYYFTASGTYDILPVGPERGDT
jgi:hypothetical protein